MGSRLCMRCCAGTQFKVVQLQQVNGFLWQVHVLGADNRILGAVGAGS